MNTTLDRPTARFASWMVAVALFAFGTACIAPDANNDSCRGDGDCPATMVCDENQCGPGEVGFEGVRESDTSTPETDTPDAGSRDGRSEPDVSASGAECDFVVDRSCESVLAFDPMPWCFGSHPRMTFVQQTATLSNVSGKPVEVTGITRGGSNPFEIVDVSPPTPTTLEPGQTIEITVEFEASNGDAQINVVSDACSFWVYVRGYGQ